MTDLERTAAALVAGDKGILAADESSGTIKKRFDAIAVESTEESRRSYREMLFTTPGLEEDISGVILYDETLGQKTKDGVLFAELLASKGVLPGIKVDSGAKPLAGFPGEKVTEGLDGLRERLDDYRERGAKFTKWRAVITIGGDVPSRACVAANVHALARYAALSQEAGLVPIVEPETLMDGGHTLDRHYEVTSEVLPRLFEELDEQRVALEGTLLKVNMTLSGTECSEQAGPEEVAEATVRCLRATVPPAIPGIVFLSGGQGDEQATQNLDAINRLGKAPWALSFSYGRALQAPALKAWQGAPANYEAGQKALHHRARMNAAARSGAYSRDMEQAAPV